MAGITEIKFRNVRSHSKASFDFAPGMNAVVGPNGSGKTTVLEGIYTLLVGSSFRGSLAEMIRYGKDYMQLKVTFDPDNRLRTRLLDYRRKSAGITKKWQIDNKSYGRLSTRARLPVVLFEPELGRLITGSPERRRHYLDNIAGQLDTEVALIQNKYDRALRQRNKLLKQPTRVALDELFVWDTQLARFSERIVNARLSVVRLLQKNLSTYYRQLGGVDDIVISYQSNVSIEPAQYASRLLHFLEASLQRDLALGYTSFGPHRDDVEFLLADQLAQERASRGEIRSIVVACKLLEAELLASHFDQQKIKPILLLDDVLSELDLVHQEQVLAGFKDYQVILTTTDAHTLTPGTHTIAL